jgi:hypothetical protein
MAEVIVGHADSPKALNEVKSGMTSLIGIWKKVDFRVPIYRERNPTSLLARVAHGLPWE